MIHSFPSRPAAATCRASQPLARDGTASAERYSVGQPPCNCAPGLSLCIGRLGFENTSLGACSFGALLKLKPVSVHSGKKILRELVTGSVADDAVNPASWTECRLTSPTRVLVDPVTDLVWSECGRLSRPPAYGRHFCGDRLAIPCTTSSA